MLLSVVIPMYNESEGLDYFHKKLLLPELQKQSDWQYEIIYVNDGSRDTTLELLTNIATKDNNVKILNLSRNFGKEIATSAGIEASTGDAVLIMDGDGQHPPQLLHDFVDKWRNGAQVVVGVRNTNQNEGIIKKWGSKLFYRLFNSASGSEIVPRSTDYRLIDKAVKQEFLRFSERNRITRGLIDWLGFKREYIEFDAPARIAGEATYKTKQLVKLAMNSFISLSLTPLFVFGWIGLLITSLALFIGIFVLVEQIILGDPLGLNITGSAMLGILTSFLVGIVLTSQGMIAIYLSHVHAQTQGRPLYIIDYAGSKNLQ